MAFLSVDNVRISGIAACVPKHIESNSDYEWITERERELLIKTTGIAHRRVAGRNICTSDMCVASARELLQKSNTDPDDIEVLIFVSQSPDYILPATSIIIQNKLGLTKNVMAFDIALGCSGYVYGLSVISNLISTGRFKKGLLLVGDVSSFSQSKTDKSTYPIFGDAGTATLLEYVPGAMPMHFNLQSDGSGYKAIIINDGGLRNPYSSSSEIMVEHEPGIIKNKRHLMLDGIEVFNFSLREAPVNVRDLLQKINTNIETIDYFLFHQANKIMNESIRKKLNIPAEKAPYSLNDFGNTSSASIPLTIVSQLANNLKGKDLFVCLSAFGVGLSWGSAALHLNKIICPPLIEIE